jgi:general secretion pathway protein B
VQDEKLLVMADLPPAIRQELPTMSIAVHAYSSNPKDRLVSINNRMLREGDILQPGLGLEQITPDGMIFSYKGYRFIRGVR